MLFKYCLHGSRSIVKGVDDGIGILLLMEECNSVFVHMYPAAVGDWCAQYLISTFQSLFTWLGFFQSFSDSNLKYLCGLSPQSPEIISHNMPQLI